MKKLIVFLGAGIFISFLSILLLLPAFGDSQRSEELVITTYYPVPYGDYQELRLRRVAIGENYKSAGEYCWEGECTQEKIRSHTDVVIQGNVGIGKHLVDKKGHKNEQQVALDVAGYASTKDLWMSEPKYGKARWTSERNVGDLDGECIETYPLYWNFWNYFPQTCQAEDPAVCVDWYQYAYWVPRGQGGWPSTAQFCDCPAGMQKVYLGGTYEYASYGGYYKYLPYNLGYRDGYFHHSPYYDAYWSYYYGPGKLTYSCYNPINKDN